MSFFMFEKPVIYKNVYVRMPIKKGCRTVKRMVKAIQEVRVLVTSTEVKALLLEANLIK